MNITKDFKNTLTKKDYLKFLLATNNILVLSPLIVISITVAAIFSIVTKGFSIVTLIYFLPVILFVVSYIKTYLLINNTVKSQKSIYESSITLTDNEYKEVTNGEHNSLSYSKAYCYKETKNYFYLHIDRLNGLIIPKRKYSEDELAKVRKAFNSKIKKTNIIDLSSIITSLIFLSLVVLIIIALITM